MHHDYFVGRELLIIKFNASERIDKEIKNFGGYIIHKDEDLINAEFVGGSEDLDKVIATLRKYNPIEVVRTGLSGISSTLKTLTI